MSTHTDNYNLVKPDYADTADIGDINGNMDIIDSTMKSQADTIASHTTSISSLATSKSNVLITDSFTSTFTAQPNASGSTAFTITKQGYTPIGIVGITGTTTSILSYSDFYLEDANTAKVYFYSRYSQARQVTLQINILYVKN